MIEGEIQDERQAVVTLEVADYLEAVGHVEFIVDTGFTDQLSLSRAALRPLGLAPFETTEVVLANGELSVHNPYKARVQWHGEWREVVVIETQDLCAIGIKLLLGSRLAIAVIDSGRVEIAPLPQV